MQQKAPATNKKYLTCMGALKFIKKYCLACMGTLKFIQRNPNGHSCLYADDSLIASN